MQFAHFLDLATAKALKSPVAGGKAQGLARLLAAGFATPPGWVVLPTAFTGDRLTTVARQNISDVITAWHARQPAVRFAVRSSGVGEDAATTSFAGVFRTVLNVAEPQDIVTAVETVYASRHQAAAYRRAHGLAPQQTMAVIIQAFVAAECAGVCLAVDPVAQRADRLVINAAWGLGAGVMDGRIPTDTYWLATADLAPLQHRIATKTIRLSAVTDGVAETAVPPAQQRVPCLPAAWQARIAQFTLALTRRFGHPQEVEWAIADRRLWIVQSRPQTALPPQGSGVAPFPVTWEDEAARDFWRLMEYSQEETPPLPLEHATQRVLESIREETCRVMGVDKNREMRVWNGRGYARRLPLAITEADRRVRRAAATHLRQRLRRSGQTTWDYWGPEIVSTVERLRQFDRETDAGAALAEHLEETLAVRRRHASLHPRLTIRPPESYFNAFTAVSGLTGDAAKTAAYHLLDSEANTLTRLTDGLYQLALLALRHSAVAALVTDAPPDVMERLAALPEAAEFRQAFSALLAVYGERSGDGYGSEASIRTPTWLEDPARPLRLVAAFLDPEIPAPAAVREQARARRDEVVAEICAACADETAVATFRQELAYARQVMVVLEDHNHWIEQASGGQVRLAVMAAARWLVARDLLAEPDEIFWLTYDEIAAALRTAALDAGLIAKRRAQHAAWSALTPPPFLGMPSAELPPRPPASPVAVDETRDEENGRLQGLGASPGRAEGPVRVFLKGAAHIDVRPGDIVVAPNAGPLWTPFFPILGGLILEEGSLGQHAAVTAREYGIPAVINLRHATRRLADGEWVALDGTTGIVMQRP